MYGFVLIFSWNTNCYLFFITKTKNHEIKDLKGPFTLSGFLFFVWSKTFSGVFKHFSPKNTFNTNYFSAMTFNIKFLILMKFFPCSQDLAVRQRCNFWSWRYEKKRIWNTKKSQKERIKEYNLLAKKSSKFFMSRRHKSYRKDITYLFNLMYYIWKNYMHVFIHYYSQCLIVNLRKNITTTLNVSPLTAQIICLLGTSCLFLCSLSRNFQSGAVRNGTLWSRVEHEL